MGFRRWWCKSLRKQRTQETQKTVARGTSYSWGVRATAAVKTVWFYTAASAASSSRHSGGHGGAAGAPRPRNKSAGQWLSFADASSATTRRHRIKDSRTTRRISQQRRGQLIGQTPAPSGAHNGVTTCQQPKEMMIGVVCYGQKQKPASDFCGGKTCTLRLSR